MTMKRLILATSLSLAILLDSSAQDNSEPILEYSDNADHLIIQLDYIPGRHFVGAEPEPHLRIYGDGRVLVHPFVVENHKGVREMYIQEREMSRLLNYMYDQGFMEFDSETVKAKKLHAIDQRRRQARSQGNDMILRTTSDASTFVMDVYLDEYKAAGSVGSPRKDFHHHVEWRALRFDANEYPEVEELVALQELAQTLRGYTNRAELVKIGEVPDSSRIEEKKRD